jgi:hypothetical protein
MMKKSRAKLPLRKETLRTLSGMDLSRITGGQGDVVVVDVDATFGRTCLAAAAAPTA